MLENRFWATKFAIIVFRTFKKRLPVLIHGFKVPSKRKMFQFLTRRKMKSSKTALIDAKAHFRAQNN